MKTLTLSDHTNDQVEDHVRGRQAAFSRKLDERNQAAERRDEKRQEYRDQFDSAVRERKVVGAVKGAWNVLFGNLPNVPPKPSLEAASREEEVWKAGNDGELKVADYLASRLSDEWTLVSGFMTGKGEIDLILIGPAGVFAFEVKYVRGTVHCDGDRWWRDKYDKYGNLVETAVPIRDARGRAPSRQLNEAADVVELLLDRRFGKGRVRRVVVLAHEDSALGTIINSTLDAVVSLKDWKLEDCPGTDRKVPLAVVEEIAQELTARHRGK